MISATSTAATTTGARHVKQRRRASSRGVSVLMYACQQGDVDRVRKIVRDQPSSLLARDRTGKSPLHYCCTSDNICAAQAADLLVMAAPDLVEGRDEDGFTPLHLAVIAGNMPLVTFLIANNADINAVDNEKHTVVHWATVCGETAALRAVLAAGAPVSTPDVHGGYPLHYAAQMCGGEKDSNLGQQVLQTLLTHPNVTVSVTDGDGRQPLLWAASAGSSKAVLALVRAGALVEASDKDGLTALHCAASRGHTDCIDSLLTLCGASPDVIDSNGCTALHYAVTLGHADATALLLAHGADPNRQDRKGRSPAHCGCAKGQFETVKMIGAHGAKLWLKNARGDLPLHEAAGSGRRDLVKWLLEMRPSQVNARNNDGRCPLHLAALNDNADMCKILLDAGAQINPILRTSKNVFMTPLDCALQRGFRSTAKYLQLHGGVPATRLGDVKGKLDNVAGVNLQIRDDVTFWGDTSSDSERENGEFTKNKKIQRKRLAHKYDKKRASLSGSDLEGNKLLSGRNRKSKTGGRTDSAIDYPKLKKVPSARFDYSNEIVINGKTEINIHQTKQINVNKEVEEPILETQVKEVVRNGIVEKRPKSAKRSMREKSGTSTVKEDSARRKMKSERPQSKLKQEKEGGNRNEVKVELQQVAPTIKSGNDLKVHDQQSLLSNTSEDVEESASMVVEVAVHEPPKDLESEDTSKKLNEEPKLHTQEEENRSKKLVKELKEQAEEIIIEEDVKNLVKDSKLQAEENGNKLVEEKQNEEKEMTVEVHAKKLAEDSQEEAKVIKTEGEVKQLDEESQLDKEVLSENHAKKLGEDSEHQRKDVTTESLQPEAKETKTEERAKKLDEESQLQENEIPSKKLAKNSTHQAKDVAIEESSKILTEGSKLQTQQMANEESKYQVEVTMSDLPKDSVVETENIGNQRKEDLKSMEVPQNNSEIVEGAEIDAEAINDAGKNLKISNEDTAKKDNDVDSTREETKLEKKQIGNEREDHEEKLKNVIAVSEVEKLEVAEESQSVSKIEENVATIVNDVDKKVEEINESITKVLVDGKEEVKSISKDETSNSDATPKVSGNSSRSKTAEENVEKFEIKVINAEQDDIKVSVEKKEKERKNRKKTAKLQLKRDKQHINDNKEQERGNLLEDAVVTGGEGDNNAIENKIEPVNEEQKQRKKHRRKWAKKGDAAYEIIDKSFGDDEDVQESKTSEESVTLSQHSDSSSSSTLKEHKSFRVLEETEKEIAGKAKRSRRKTPPKKQRSRSEENKSTKNREKLKRSKIPTPLIRNSLSKSDKYLDIPDRKVKSNLESRVPSLPNIHQNKEHPRSESNMSAPLLPSVYSDNERGSGSDLEEEKTSAIRKRRVKRKLKTRDSRSAGSDYESSNVIDSGFEPSPRSSRIPRWKNMSERGVNMTSVTQTIQTNIRRYHLERKIFQHLLELKRMQIRAGQHNEAILVKRAIDTYHQSCASTVGAGRYVPEDYTFRSFEKFLYLSLRKLQRNDADHLKGLPEPPVNPLFCTRSTNRCMHATHAYTGIPCAAYLPMMDHHTMPKIGFSSTQCKPGTGFLPTINPKKAVTLELCHGPDKQIISLPADKLDHNKRYYVTFTVKGGDALKEDSIIGHTHPKSD